MNKTLTRIVTNIMDKIGYKIIPKWRWNNYELATHTRDIFELLKINCVLDVGANKGQYGNFLRTHVGYSGQIFSFEPVKKIYDKLLLSSKLDPLWEVFPFAFGSKNGSFPINITKHHTLNSFLTPEITGLTFNKQFHLDDFNSVVHSETVKMKKIDSFFEEDLLIDLKKSRIFMKLDTQGYDNFVIEGAKNSISEICAIQSEISCIHIYQGMEEYFQSIENFKNYGFDVTGMFPVNRDQWFRVVEFDFLAINRNKVVGNQSYERP